VGLPVGTCGFVVGVTSRCCVKRVQEKTEGRGFARRFRPWAPNPGTGVRGIFKKIRISLSWDYRNALGQLGLIVSDP
jgi:hypothetical protein